MTQLNALIRTLNLWTNGDASVGLAGETAEVSAPGWLFNREDFAADELQAQLDEFKNGIVAAFSLIWDEKVHAAYDFELALEDAE